MLQNTYVSYHLFLSVVYLRFLEIGLCDAEGKAQICTYTHNRIHTYARMHVRTQSFHKIEID